MAPFPEKRAKNLVGFPGLFKPFLNYFIFCGWSALGHGATTPQPIFDNMNIKNLMMWGVIVLLVVGLFQLFQNPQKTTTSGKIPFSNFLKQVEEGRVDEVEIQGNNINGILSLMTCSLLHFAHLSISSSSLRLSLLHAGLINKFLCMSILL